MVKILKYLNINWLLTINTTCDDSSIIVSTSPISITPIDEIARRNDKLPEQSEFPFKREKRNRNGRKKLANQEAPAWLCRVHRSKKKGGTETEKRVIALRRVIARCSKFGAAQQQRRFIFSSDLTLPVSLSLSRKRLVDGSPLRWQTQPQNLIKLVNPSPGARLVHPLRALPSSPRL